MNDKTVKQPSTFSKYTKGLLSRPQTGVANEPRTEPQTCQPKSRNLCYHAESSISAIATSPDLRRVVIAGREVLKILSLEPYEIVEKYNLRASHRTNLSYSSNDVKWGIGATSGIVATATSNGSIVVWDLEYASSKKVDRVINGHNRAVNRLDFNPGNGSWLLSASQDGSMKLWDLRDRDGSARFVLHGKAEAVRDVSFNSTNALELAAVYDNGTLQKWDLRNPKIYEKKLNAHHGLALALDWHTDGKHLATGGRDKIIKVWDLSSDMRRPVRYLQTMAPVARVAWRPGSSATNCELASCALSMDNTISLWDLTRPYIASRTFANHTAAPTGILWKNSDTLLSCSKDQSFRQHSVRLAPAPIDSVSHYAFGWNTVDDIAICLGDRQLDKARMHASHQRIDSQDSSSPDLVRDTHKSRKEHRSGSLMEVLNPRASTFSPTQSFAIIFSEDDNAKLFRHLATEYVINSEHSIRACARNALTAHQARRPEASKAWKLIKLGLEHLERAHRRGPRQRKPSLNQSLTMSRLGDSLIRRDIERLRSTPQMADSGLTTMRGSPAISFIMPKYVDNVPPLSLTASSDTVQPRAGVNSSLHTPMSREYRGTRKPSAESPLHRPIDMILPSPAMFAEAIAADSNLETGTGTDPALVSQRPSRAQTDATSSPVLPQQYPPHGPRSNETASPRPNTSMSNSREFSKLASFDVLEEMTVGMERAREELQGTVSRILRHYQDQGDVQMCSSICLVLRDHVSASERRVDEWLYCYIDLLRRHKLFSTASEVINNTSSEFIRAQAEGDIVMHTSCSRCKKAVPLVRELGDYWMCPRCQNTVLCIVCGVVVKGAGSWCRLCAHTAHHRCRQRLGEAHLGSTCVVPDCHCECQGLSV